MNGSPGDLLGEPGAAGALDAPLPVEQHLAGQRERLRPGPLGLGEPRLAAPVGHRLVLQRALAALVADRAVQRVVDEQELHDAVLGLVGHRRGELGLDDHARHHGGGAGRLRLRHPAAVPGVGDLHQALPAGADRFEQRMLAEPGIWMPSSSAARMISVPFGTSISKPSMVQETISTFSTAALSSVTVTGTSPEGGLGRVEGAAALLEVPEVLVPEQLDGRDDGAGRAVAEGAERAAEDVVGDVQQGLQVLLGALAASSRFSMSLYQ